MHFHSSVKQNKNWDSEGINSFSPFGSLVCSLSRFNSFFRKGVGNTIASQMRKTAYPGRPKPRTRTPGLTGI